MILKAVGFGGLAFAVLTASLLSAVIIRSPQTHDHIAASLRPSYDRTPLDSVRAVDLPAILADLPEFSFPEPIQVAASPRTMPAVGVAHEPGDEHSPAEHGIAAEQPQVQKITLRQFEYGFDQERVELQVGVPVEITVVNEGNQPHGIWIPDLAISEDVRSGRTKTITFTPERPGRIRFTCNNSLCGTEEEHAQVKGYLIIVG